MELLEIQTFGGLKIHLNQARLDVLKTRKVEALLVYLAMIGQPVERSLLADLFWRKQQENKALTSLRVAISNLRQYLASFLSVTRYQIGIHPDADLWLDAIAFENSINHGKVETALELYQGRFLDGFHLRGAPGFEEWHRITQEQYHLQIQDGFHNLIGQEYTRGEIALGLQHTLQLLHLDPLDEIAHQYAMRFYAYKGARNRAIQQYLTCQQILMDEIGAAPDPVTTRLFDTIRKGEFPAPGAENKASKPTSRIYLPADLTPFVGREKEVEQITGSLKDKDTRLVTILGPGGIGKTRLSLDVSRYLQRIFEDGIFFIPLAALQDPSAISTKIASVLGIPLQGGAEVNHQVFSYLRTRQLFLILDNFEHLMPKTGFLKELLQAASKVKVLVTSREKLHLPGETVFHLEGMRYPDNLDTADLRAFGSLALFLQAARWTDPVFEIDDDNLAAIIEICQVVEGMPLAIELAASWLDMLSITDIVQELRKSFDFLSAPTAHKTDRHHSLRVVFESSWERLRPAEQSGFARLSVFRGGFTSNAASAVCGISLRQLSIFINKSLLYPPKAGRYQIHEMLRQFGEEMLARNPNENQQTQDLHARYYGNLIHREFENIDRGEKDRALLEIDNVRASWRFAVLNNQYATIKRMIDGFSQLLNLQGWLQEEVAAFSWAESRMNNEGNVDDPGVAYGQVLIHYGYSLSLSGDLQKGLGLLLHGHDILMQANAVEEAAWARLKILEIDNFKDRKQSEKQLRASLEVFNTLNIPHGIGRTRLHLGLHALFWGDLDRAETRFLEMYPDYIASEDFVGAAFTVFNLGRIADFRGHYSKAKEHYHLSIQFFNDVGFFVLIGVLHKYLGYVHLAENNSQGANEFFSEYLERNKDIGIEWRVAEAQSCLAKVAIHNLDFETANGYLDITINQFSNNENRYVLRLCYCHQAYLAYIKGEYRKGAQRFLTAIQDLSHLHNLSVDLLIMAQGAPLLAKMGEISRAIEFASLALNYPKKHQPFIQHEARKSLKVLKTLLSDAEYHSAMESGRNWDFEHARIELIELLTGIAGEAN